MLTTVSLGTKRLSPYVTYDSRCGSIFETRKPLFDDSIYKKRLSITSASDTVNKTTSSTSLLFSLLKEIQNKREVKSYRRESVTGTVFVNQKSKLYEWKYRVYNFFNKPDNYWAISYHLLVFCLVFTCLIFTVFSSIAGFAELASKVLTILEKIIIIWFFSEFCLRLWSSSCKEKYDGWKGKVSYMRVPSHMLDLIIILLSVVVLIAETGNGNEVFAVSAIRGFHRLFHVFQMLTLHRQIQPWKLLLNVMRDQMHQLLIMVYIQFISIFILAFISYILEKDAKNTQITSLAEAMWWAVITLSTVGYGDRVHVTWWGKLVSSVFTLLGVALFALPAGIIGAGLAIRVEKEESSRLKKKKKSAAVVLIQSMWRCYKVNARPDIETRSSQLFIVTDFHDNYESVMKFLSITKFFVAKSKFKKTRNVLDLDNSLNAYKYSQSAVNSRVKQIHNFVETIDKSVTDNENRLSRHQKKLINRMENIYSLIDYIESEINRQNLLIDFISFNSVSNGNQLKGLSKRNAFKTRHPSLREQPFNKDFNFNSTTIEVK